VIVPPEDKSYSVSAQFQWIPSDFSVSDLGEVDLSSPYINNIHPTHHAHLYRVIPQILQRTIPMFERVLSDLSRPMIPWKVKSTQWYLNDHSVDIAPCIWPNSKPYAEDPEEENETDMDAWYMKHPKILPDAKGPYKDDLKIVQKTVSLKGSTVQCIVKLANIVLTPDQPDYIGEKWQVEGVFDVFHRFL
jgi:hypothetical protein